MNLSIFYDVLKLKKQVNSKRILISTAQGLQELICKPAQPRRQRQPKKAFKGNRVFPREARAVILTRIEGLNKNFQIVKIRMTCVTCVDRTVWQKHKLALF